jgi:hypothetical protein
LIYFDEGTDFVFSQYRFFIGSNRFHANSNHIPDGTDFLFAPKKTLIRKRNSLFRRVGDLSATPPRLAISPMICSFVRGQWNLRQKRLLCRRISTRRNAENQCPQGGLLHHCNWIELK